MLFTDEQTFTIKEPTNKMSICSYHQNERPNSFRYLKEFNIRLIRLWVGNLFYDGVAHLYVCEKKVNNSAKVHQYDALLKDVKPLNITVPNIISADDWV